MQRHHTGILLSTLIVAVALGSAANEPNPAAPARNVVAQRIDAFNNHDIDAYLSAHAEDVRIYEYPDRLIGNGRSHLQRIFGPQFAHGIGSVIVNDQQVIADYVVSNESLTLGSNTEHLIVIYTIIDGKIAELRLIEP